MSTKPEGWHIDASPPSWDSDAKTFSFFSRKSGHEWILCTFHMNVLESAVKSSDLSDRR